MLGSAEQFAWPILSVNLRASQRRTSVRLRSVLDFHLKLFSSKKFLYSGASNLLHHGSEVLH